MARVKSQNQAVTIPFPGPLGSLQKDLIKASVLVPQLLTLPEGVPPSSPGPLDSLGIKNAWRGGAGVIYRDGVSSLSS